MGVFHATSGRLGRAICIILGGAFVIAFGNQAPVVSASAEPVNPATNGNTHLVGMASDDLTSFDSLVFHWRQISGPALAQVADTTSNTTIATFPQAGVYVLELQVSDGGLVGSDSVQVTVHEKMPFTVLKPFNGARIGIGKPYTIRWQMDPSYPCDVHCSVDEGLSWKKINEMGAVSDSFLWEVDSSYIPGTQGQIKVEQYQTFSNFAISDFVFVSASTPESRSEGGCGSGAGLAPFPPILFKLSSIKRRRKV